LKSPPGNKLSAQNDLLTPPPPYENRKSFVVESSQLGDRKNLNLNNLHSLNKGSHQATSLASAAKSDGAISSQKKAANSFHVNKGKQMQVSGKSSFPNNGNIVTSSHLNIVNSKELYSLLHH
jgi:hypothetical protein